MAGARVRSAITNAVLPEKPRSPPAMAALQNAEMHVSLDTKLVTRIDLVAWFDTLDWG